MDMFKRNEYLHLVSILLFIFILSGQGVYGQEGGDLKKAAFVPFESSLAAGEDLAEQFRLTLALTMKEQELLDPYRLEIWLNDKYGVDKAKNVDEILTTMGELGFDVLFVCHGYLFRTGPNYGIRITLFSMDDVINDSHYMRFFDLPGGNEESINKKIKEICTSIVDEMNSRALMPVKTHFDKTLFIEKFMIKLIQIDEIKATGTKIPTVLPIININGIEYKDTDHFFHELLLYKLHTTGLFHLKNCNMARYIQEPPVIPEDVDYTVSGYLFIEQNFNMLMIDIKNRETGELVQNYMFPFTEITMESLDAAMRRNSLLVGLAALELKERERIGTAEIVPKNDVQPIFCNNIYLGMADQTHLLLPSGQNDIKIGDKVYKMFVYPFTMNYQYWDIEDSIITNMLGIIEEGKTK
jgi:hypothetical protein